MAKIAEMTQLSPTMSEGKIVRWLKQKGDSVSPGEIIAEVETDKAVMEMEAFETGVLLEILAPEGSLLPVGAPVAIIGKSGEDISTLVETAKKSIPAKKKVRPHQAKLLPLHRARHPQQGQLLPRKVKLLSRPPQRRAQGRMSETTVYPQPKKNLPD